ncbi:hypothetical protein SAMN04487764_0982 [Gillisia sp. Hel1_33_143]|nr:hypothetical protein SAMN04487764_0982 [Gillisia sp. Hel1_33_143]
MYICYVNFKRLHILFSLLLLASLNAFSSNTFDSEDLFKDLNSRNYDYLQADQNKQALFLEETSIASFQIDSENNSGNFGTGINFTSTPPIPLSGLSSNRITTGSQDIKYFLELQIFPFHFFW